MIQKNPVIPNYVIETIDETVNDGFVLRKTTEYRTSAQE